MAMVKETPDGYPAWVDKFYFNDILRKDYSQFKVVRFNVAPLNAKGENYASLMFRAKLTVENSETGLAHRNFVVKASLPNSLDLGGAFDLFPKEIQMYTEILPQFEALYKEVGETVRFGPKCFVGTRDPGDLIIMEDLCVLGYRAANRLVGLDFEHTKLVIATLAKMHAASAVFVEKGNVFEKKFDEGIYSEAMKTIMVAMGKKSEACMKECVAQWKCAETMKRCEKDLQDTMMNKVFNLAKRNDSRFNVLCHGDMWSNNIMFKYNENDKVEEAILVDFQMCNYNSPMLDLQYFIYSSTQHDIKMNRVDHIIQYYHQQLVANLKKLGYSKKLPTLLELQKDFLELGHFGVMTAFGTFSIAVAPPGDDADMSSFMGDDEAANNFQRRLFLNPVYMSGMEDLVPYFELKGLMQADE